MFLKGERIKAEYRIVCAPVGADIIRPQNNPSVTSGDSSPLHRGAKMDVNEL